MTIKAGDSITRKNNGGEFRSTGVVGLVLGDKKTVLCASQNVAWHFASANGIVKNGSPNDPLLILDTDAATLKANGFVRFPQAQGGLPGIMLQTAALAQLTTPAETPTCSRYKAWPPANAANLTKGDHPCTWTYQKPGANGRVVVAAYKDSYLIRDAQLQNEMFGKAGVQNANRGQNIAGSVYVDEGCALAMCMGLSRNEADATVWVPIRVIVNEYGITSDLLSLQP